MRKWVFGFLFLGLASLLYAQEPRAEVSQIVLEGVTVTSPNFDYLAMVQDKNTPETVKGLERKAASFDLIESPVYNKIDKAYEVFFSNSKGRIVATYDDKGKILSSVEKFANVVVPAPIRNTVYHAYPEWTMSENTYMVTYFHNKGVKKTYHFQISKGDETKNLKLVWKARR
ncbi:MAG: hypothetical protein ABF295_09370 [Flavobacteriaceae bacterium]